MQAILALEDGTIFYGESFGVPGERFGEVVFNTGMTGYQEVLTDPSYMGQMVTMTYPHIGNYGSNSLDCESSGPCVEAFIVRDYTEVPSSYRSQEGLGELLRRHGVVAVTDVDTRALTRHLRDHGAMKAIVSTEDSNEERLVRRARESQDISEKMLVRKASTKSIYHWDEGTPDEWLHADRDFRPGSFRRSKRPYRVVAIDCGLKRNILRRLVDSGCVVDVVPYDTPAEEILRLEPEGVFISNGPGDPENVPEVVETAKSLIGVRPIFGICLGHQLLGMAAGGKKVKLRFGHHGCNHPVRVMSEGVVNITSQNHNYVIEAASLDPDLVEVTHVNLNDGTLEGLRYRKAPVYALQYHPEASPGPHDASSSFMPFVEMMEERR